MSTSQPRVRLVPLNASDFLEGSAFFRYFCYLFHVYLCYDVLSVPCSFVITCWKKGDHLALLCVVFSCVFVTFPYGILGQEWYLIV